MKKSLLLIFSSLFIIFSLAGCSDDDKDNKSTSNFPADLSGTYNITFFGTQVTNTQPSKLSQLTEYNYVTNDCTKAKELYPDVIDQNNKNMCISEAKLLDGQVVISISDNIMNISSRVQMEGEILDLSSADKYQFTEYYPTITFSNIEANGKGVKGWNYDSDNNTISANSTEFPESPYQVTKREDGTIMVVMTLVGKNVVMGSTIITIDAKTTILLEKESEATSDLENDIQVPFTTN